MDCFFCKFLKILLIFYEQEMPTIHLTRDCLSGSMSWKRQGSYTSCGCHTHKCVKINANLFGGYRRRADILLLSSVSGFKSLSTSPLAALLASFWAFSSDGFSQPTSGSCCHKERSLGTIAHVTHYLTTHYLTTLQSYSLQVCEA